MKIQGKLNITRQDEGILLFFQGLLAEIKSQDGEERLEITNGRFDIDLKHR